jgi:ribosome-binding factor A
MTDHRSARLNEQLKREISQILNRKVRDPRVGRVLVTETRVTSDLSLARVFFRVLEEKAELEDTLEGLDAAAPFVRRELGQVLSLRRIPELRFVHDTSLDSARRIEEILSEVLPEGGGGGDPSEESRAEEGEGGDGDPLGGSSA